MSLVQCRYNPNHKMRKNKLEIHESKCPSRLKCAIKYIQCPYDPTHKIKEEEYGNHILECKSKPNLNLEEKLELARVSFLNDNATEKEQIKMAREKYYKGCVEEEDIEGLGKASKKKNKKKQTKKIKEKFSDITKKEASIFGAMASKDETIEENGLENHELDNLPADDNFELKNEGEMEEKIEGFGNNNDNIETIKKLENKERKNSENENQNNNKILNEEKNKNDSKKSKIDFKKNYNFFRYNPNEEDKEIHKYSANILVPEEINKILGI